MTNGEWFDEIYIKTEEPMRTFFLIYIYNDFTDKHRLIFEKYYGTVQERYEQWRNEKRKEGK